MKKLNNKGFSLVEGLLILVIVGIIGFVGWYVWSNSNSDSTSNSTTTITNFQQCKDAGNPVQESFPEKCTASGQTYTNESQSANSDDITKTLELSTKTVSFSLPDAWTYEKSLNNCPQSVGADITCIEGAVITPGEKIETKYGSGTEFFKVLIGVYQNKNNSSPKKWVEEDYQEGSTFPNDVTSSSMINGYDSYYWKKVIENEESTYHEIRYVFAAKGKIVMILVRTYEPDTINGKQVGDFRKFEPAIDTMAKTIEIN